MNIINKKGHGLDRKGLENAIIEDFFLY